VKRRLAKEWLILVACCIVGIPIKNMIDGPPNFDGVVLGPVVYAALGVIRITIASYQALTSR
jgi:hypothetical protein